MLTREQKIEMMKWEYGIGMLLLTMEMVFLIIGVNTSAFLTWFLVAIGLASLAHAAVLERQLHRDNHTREQKIKMMKWEAGIGILFLTMGMVFLIMAVNASAFVRWFFVATGLAWLVHAAVLQRQLHRDDH